MKNLLKTLLAAVVLVITTLLVFIYFGIYIVKHGIKMTGMPAWGESHNDQELWDIIAFIRELPRMTPQQYQELTGNAGKEAQHGH